MRTKQDYIDNYQKCKNEIIDIIDKSRLSKDKKKRIKDLLTDLLLTQTTLTSFDLIKNTKIY